MERRLLIRDKRERLGLTLRQVEIELEFASGSLSQIEKGKLPTSNDGFDLIDAALDKLGQPKKGEGECQEAEGRGLASSSLAI